MSGIYISGMKMPKSCGECKFFAWKRGVGNHCAIDESITFHPTLDGFDVRYEKRGNCPFIAVPDHGRLIDADALEKLECNQCDGACDVVGCDCINCDADCRCDFMLDLHNAPTIIPADKDGEL